MTLDFLDGTQYSGDAQWSDVKIDVRPRIKRHAPTWWQWLFGATAEYEVQEITTFSASFEMDIDGVTPGEGR